MTDDEISDDELHRNMVGKLLGGRPLVKTTVELRRPRRFGDPRTETRGELLKRRRREEREKGSK